MSAQPVDVLAERREQAAAIARFCAKQKPESYYAEPFQPHEWVIDAVAMALAQVDELAAGVVMASVTARRAVKEHTAAKNRRKAAFKAFTAENGGDYYVSEEDNDPACEAAIRECKLSGQSVTAAKAALRHATDRYAAALARCGGGQ